MTLRGARGIFTDAMGMSAAERISDNGEGGTGVGRHSGAVCKACQRRILVRDGKLIEHWHQFPTLGKTLLCVGSHSEVPDDWARQEALNGRAKPGGRVRPDPARAG